MKVWKSEKTVYAQVKRDGIYLKVVKDSAGQVRCYSRLETDLTKQLRYLGWYANVLRRVPAPMTIIGELWSRGHPASYVKTAIKEREPLWFEVFQVPTLHSAMSLEQLQDLCRIWGLRFIPFVRLDTTTPEEYIANTSALPANVEGYVFKNSNGSEAYKWKPIHTIDAEVVGFTEGKGKYIGLIGAMSVAIAGREIALVSGMSDKVRAEVSYKPEDFLGKVCEVRYQCIGTKGRLRHPAFLRWRDDKRATDCLLGQDPKLMEYWLGTPFVSSGGKIRYYNRYCAETIHRRARG